MLWTKKIRDQLKQLAKKLNKTAASVNKGKKVHLECTSTKPERPKTNEKLLPKGKPDTQLN